MRLALPFVGRKREAGELRLLHAQRKHALILSPAGMGKTALLSSLSDDLNLLVCPHSERLGAICESLEAEFRLIAGDLKLLQRKQRLLRALAQAQRTVVFDGTGWTTPRLSSFLEGAMERVPVWICARSEHPWDIGHVWPLLWNFVRVELKPFVLADTRSLIETCVEEQLVPADVLSTVEWLQHRSKGNPFVLRELLGELSSHSYDLGNPHALELLDIDRRIHELFPVGSDAEKPKSPRQ